MSKLKVKCETCGHMVDTGIDVSREEFMSMTMVDRSIECPNCETILAWNLDDVDVSVFPPARKKTP
jgi:endogenous inhibitor of DNA gyrase (YacG/DUF329 family)